MGVPSTAADISTTAGSNFPAGSEAPSTLDDYLRAVQAILKQENAKGADTASAAAVTIPAAGKYFIITGSTTITSFVDSWVGRTVFLKFSGAVLLTHAAGLILPTGANITTAAGDVFAFVNESTGVWRCVFYQPATGYQAYAASASQVEMEAGTESGLRAVSPLRIAQAIAALTPKTATIFGISAAVGSNALTISAGSLTLDFRSATIGSGTVTTVTGDPADLVISSGSTLGAVSGQVSRIAVLALNNSGTIELAAVNIAGGVSLTETGVISTTAEGGAGAADSATVVYSTTARSNLAYRVIGYVESTQATAGTWATAPSTIQGAGGQALTAMSSLGYGQTWQAVTRNTGTTYYNTTGRPILLAYASATPNQDFKVDVNGVTVVDAAGGATNGQINGLVLIPPNASYVVTHSGTPKSMTELR